MGHVRDTTGKVSRRQWTVLYSVMHEVRTVAFPHLTFSELESGGLVKREASTGRTTTYSITDAGRAAYNAGYVYAGASLRARPPSQPIAAVGADLGLGR